MGHPSFSSIDKLIIDFDRNVLSVFASARGSQRPYPAKSEPEVQLSDDDRKMVEGLMRVNHAGEISAQALYQGQAMVARDEQVKASMHESAEEERDHLYWCKCRLDELGGRTSYLNPLWYVGSFAIGSIAGFIGDKWSLGFIEETEIQVGRHLESHLNKLPVDDKRTSSILRQMQIDEAHHRDKAVESGAAELPPAIKRVMSVCSKVMTKTAFWV